MRRSSRVETIKRKPRADNYNAYDRYSKRVTYKTQIPIPDDKLGELNWPYLSENPKAISFLEKHLDRIVWPELSGNPCNDAIDLIVANNKKFSFQLYSNPCPRAIEEIARIMNSPKPSPRPDWYGLSKNVGALSILEKNPTKIEWQPLCRTGSSEFIPLLRNKKNLKYITGYYLLSNENDEYVKLFLDLFENELTSWLHISLGYFLKNPSDTAVTYILNHPNIIRSYSDCTWLAQNTNQKILPMLEKIISDGLVRIDLQANNNGNGDYDDDDDDNEGFDIIDFWVYLSGNPVGIPILKNYHNNIFWNKFSSVVDETCEELLEQQIIKNEQTPATGNLIDKENIDWWVLCLRAPKTLMPFLERHKDKIDWDRLSQNPNAIELLSKSENMDKISWDMLSRNESAIELLRRNPDKINWFELSTNKALWKQTVPELPKIIDESTKNYPKSVDTKQISNLVSHYLGGKKMTRKRKYKRYTGARSRCKHKHKYRM